MNNQPLPPNFKIWQLGLGFANTNVLVALVKTGIPEQLRESSKSLSELTESCRVNKDILRRVLRFARAIDVIAIDGDLCSLTETGRLLLKGVPGSLATGLLLLGSEPWQKSWNFLSHSLITGEPAFDTAMGNTFFDYLNEHPEHGVPYNNWMTNISVMTSQAICDAYDFSPYQSVCDVGGGHGVLLKSILQRNPNLRGVLFDQESVVKNHLLNEVSGRVEVRPGDFFKSVPSADVIIMKSIIHDWDDDKSRLILSSCKKAMTPASRLLLVEMVIGNENDIVGFFYDLHMQVLLGGRERTEEEFRSLLQSAGLNMTRVIMTKSPMKIIEVTLWPVV